MLKIHLSHSHTTLSVLVVIIMSLTLLPAISLGQLTPGARAAGVTPAGLQDYERWVGSQHSHVNMDGDDGAAGSTAAQAFTYARNLPHLQYFIVTPHLHASRSGSATLWYESTYDTIRASAASATTASFVAIAGVEVSTISSGGHWNLYNAQDLVGQDHPDGDWNDANDYYEHIAGLGAAGENIAVQFNHPNSGDFGNRYDPAAAPYVGTFAISNDSASTTNVDFSANGSKTWSLWATYLNLGWKISPAADQDNHQANWGAASSEYTVIVRAKNTTLNQTNVLGGLREHMTYATEDANMQIGFIANGWSMGQTIGGNANVAFTIWWNNPSATLYNNNVGVSRTETANDVIKNIWIYKNGFDAPVASQQPNTTSGAWNVTLPAAPGNWFVVKFQDSSSLSTSRTADYTWSAPVWYDPTHADPPLLVDGSGPTPTGAPLTATATPVPPTPTPNGTSCSVVKINEIVPAASVVYSSDWVELYNPTAATVTIGGCIMDDITGGGGAPYTIPAGATIAPYGYWTVDIANIFNNSGDTVNLIAPNGVTVIDTYTFGSTTYDVSWYRLPDGGAWQATTGAPTKGASNGGTPPTLTPALSTSTPALPTPTTASTNTPVPPTPTIAPTNTPVPPTPTPISPTSTALPTNTPMPSGILLVDDDQGQAFQTYYANALTALGKSFSTWSVSSQGSPSAATLQSYSTVIWFTGDDYSNTLLSADITALTTYLNGGGKLFISGQDIGYHISSDPFYANYLHASFRVDDTNVYDLAGADFMSGISINISGGDGANNQNYPSEISPVNGGWGLFDYSGATYAWGAVAADTGAYRVVYCSFGLEGINSAASRNTVMNAILNWLNGSPNPTPTPVPPTATPLPPTATPSACPNASGGYCRTDNETRAWIAGTTNQSVTGDDQVKNVALPFTFRFAGADYVAINISSNGHAHFGTAASAYNNANIPNTAAPNALIAAFWDDLNPSAGGAIYTAVSGAAPNRVFVIEWRDVRRYGAGDSGATFEIQLTETSNHIWIVYQDSVFGSSSYDYGLSATAGIENAGGTAGNKYSYNAAMLANGRVLHFWPQ